MSTPRRSPTPRSSAAADPRSPARTPGARVLVGTLAAIAVLGALVIALAGAWIGTSLAVFHDGPVWLAAVGAVVCFFVVPLVWELLADRHQVGGRLRDAILRSAFLSLAFVVVLLATHPATAFKALATRGDWFLGGARGPAADAVRGLLADAADGLEWLYGLAREHAFRDAEDPSAAAADRTPAPTPSTRVPSVASEHVAALARWTIPGASLTWPLDATPHPAVSGMPESARTSMAGVGRYLAEQVPDPYLRTKAVHDFVATWVAYDVEALREGTAHAAGRQGAARVFSDRKAVCAGYANLMVALGKAAGLEVVYIAGDSRSTDDYEALAPDELPRSDAGHAWNAVRIGDAWHLLDATWDAGYVGPEGFVPRYSTTYLFIPPGAMRLTHLPDMARWQLVAEPIDRGTWLRQPLLRPTAHAYGVALLEPTRPVLRGADPFNVRLDNPGRVWLHLGERSPDGSTSSRCGPEVSDARPDIVCDLGAHGGRRVVTLWGALGAGQPATLLGSLLVDLP